MVGFGRTPIIIVLLLLFGACVRSQAVSCGDLMCPVDSVCTKANTCVSGSLVTACSARADGAVCMLSELGNGTCQDGLCITGMCGDGKVNGIEACDGKDLGGKTCTDFSPPGTTNKFYRGGAPTCTVDCKINLSSCTGGWCGDGVKQFGEDCDGTDFGTPATTCASLGHPGAATPPACNVATCTFTDDTCSCGLNGICPAATPTCVNNGGTYSCTK